ncbi:MAG: hypothetical protein ISP90_02110 [Nevskia sp.]|nr:hypothetical protein [Nevskia sp.]
MLASIRARLKACAIAASPLLLSACGQDDGTGTQKFEALAIPLLFMTVLVATQLFARRKPAMLRTGA